MMLTLTRRGKVTSEEYEACRVTVTNAQKVTMAEKTLSYYEVSGRERFCIIGIIPHALLSRDATIWVLWFKDSNPTRGELREGLTMMRQLDEIVSYDLHADVLLDDTIANHFARFYNLQPTAQYAGYQMYKGVS